ncbi:hypothetical protein FN846DRAFT_903649 [Sphaerosporella brunnea]|uniref:Uncharacterized protein n=1 Tax=Sphaerosporella brunnea TaxID=1250544 RepID=A0A5J5F6H2_9PEZI|nr:hypothetical protein FN846DRAFT_903649 [Sphaerosporella brunnea]
MSAVPVSSGSGIDHRFGQRAAAPSLADEEDDVMQAFHKKINAFYEAAGSRTPSGQRSSPYMAFPHKRRIIFREQVAGKQSMDAIEDYDSGTEADTESDVEGTAGDGTEIHSDHDAPEGADSAAEAVLNSSSGLSDLSE